MENSRSVTVLITLAMAVGLAPAVVCGADSLAQCAQLPDDAERLACYDRLAGRAPSVPTVATGLAATQSSGPAPATAPARAAVVASEPAAAPDPVADFGLSQQALKERDPDGWAESITGTVGSVAQSASGRYVVALDNGQVWAQTETNAHPVLKAGDVVKIKRAALGSFVLNGPRSVSWRVRRVR